MKKLVFLLLAVVLLGSVSVNAQSKKAPKKAESETPLKGDVNGDGKVDVADIVAILKIMKDGGGTREGTKYYWYVGQTDPSTMTSISPIVTDTSSPGWRFTGNTLTTSYNYDTNANPIVGTSKAAWYFALPQNSGLGVFDAINTNYAVGTPVLTVTLNGIIYNIWMTGATRNFNAYYIRNK